ncbi:MAG: hypothetical protein FD181_544 [Prolixibacteraceae bacterium]|nr:MAG: hypothetical protein FD181_544 [Prolixibacteraceae bacterium]
MGVIIQIYCIKLGVVITGTADTTVDYFLAFALVFFNISQHTSKVFRNPGTKKEVEICLQTCLTAVRFNRISLK